MSRSRFEQVSRGKSSAHRIGVVEGALDPQQFTALAATFPDIQFEMVGAEWPDSASRGLAVLLVEVDAARATDIDALAQRLRLAPRELEVVVLLSNADVATTRLLLHQGAADILPEPVSDTSLTVTLDKLLRRGAAETEGRQQGEIIAVLKAGGGVGATALAVQSAAMAARKGASICLADLDLQFGAAALYMDMAETATVSDCLSAGADLKDVDFGALLGRHPSGLQLLAAPRQVTPLEALTPHQAEALLNGLRRSFNVVLLDLPSVWTAWTNRALQMVDRILIVTQLSVPHLHMLHRQIATLRTQGLDDRRLTLVCNALSPEQTTIVQLKSAERALGRAFDVVVPEDRKVMYAAVNRSAEIGEIRRGSKLDKPLGELAAILAPAASAERANPWWSRKL